MRGIKFNGYNYIICREIESDVLPAGGSKKERK